MFIHPDLKKTCFSGLVWKGEYPESQLSSDQKFKTYSCMGDMSRAIVRIHINQLVVHVML